MMKVLVGCEESQIVCKAFRAKGHEAFSCDLKPCSGGRSEWHIRGDVMDALYMKPWNIIILHPDCTRMAVSGNRYYAGTREREEAVQWTVNLWEKAISVCSFVCLENPVSVIFQHLWSGETQYIQPWQFGHGETKKTGLYLHCLPRLRPSNIVNGREQRILKMPPSENRKELRSKTYPGIAAAMAAQWGSI